MPAQKAAVFAKTIKVRILSLVERKCNKYVCYLFCNIVRRRKSFCVCILIQMSMGEF